MSKEHNSGKKRPENHNQVRARPGRQQNVSNLKSCEEHQGKMTSHLAHTGHRQPKRKKEKANKDSQSTGNPKVGQIWNPKRDSPKELSQPTQLASSHTTKGGSGQKTDPTTAKGQQAQKGPAPIPPTRQMEPNRGTLSNNYAETKQTSPT